MSEEHERHISVEETSVLKWVPTARITTDGSFYAVQTDEYMFPSSSSVEDAWKAAFTVMQEVNAYYLWINAGHPFGQSFGDWIDAMWNIENGPSESTTPVPSE